MTVFTPKCRHLQSMRNNLPDSKWISHNILLHLNILHCFHFGANACITKKLSSLYSRVKLKNQTLSFSFVLAEEEPPPSG